MYCTTTTYTYLALEKGFSERHGFVWISLFDFCITNYVLVLIKLMPKLKEHFVSHHYTEITFTMSSDVDVDSCILEIDRSGH